MQGADRKRIPVVNHIDLDAFSLKGDTATVLPFFDGKRLFFVKLVD